MKTIRKITYWNVRGSIIYIKTDTKFLKYKIRHVRKFNQVCSTMNTILNDFKFYKLTNY
jgi:hypothetical protein